MSKEMTLGWLFEKHPEKCARLWSGRPEPLQQWWCRHCQRVCYAANIALEEYSGGWLAVCPYDDCAADSEGLYWWHGWPSHVVVGWTAWHEPGKVYPLPCDWFEDDHEEPGCDREKLADLVSSVG